MSPQTSPTQIPAPQLSKRRQAVLILAPHCSQKKKKKKANIETHRTDGKGGISSTLRSSCELKTDLDKLRVIENGSKQELRLLPISLSLITINFCRVLTRRKKTPQTFILEMGSTTCTHTFHSWCWIQKMFRTQRNSGYLICSWTEQFMPSAPTRDTGKDCFPHYSLRKQSLQTPPVMKD